MNGNSRNPNDFDDDNLFGLKKKTYWEIYGVKRFPYRGKRKFTTLLSQSLDGGMVISNDVFGLTISQFERMYKACLERRKTKEQWIINLRYPDKSSKEYLEYLENCTDCGKAQWLWMENALGAKYLYENLVQIVGTEIDIRTRQRLFIVIDKINNSGGIKYRTQIFSGSLAEGLDLPGSDIDIMYVIKNVEIIQNTKKVNNPKHRTFLYVMETDIHHPGFTRLRSIERNDGKYVYTTCYDCPPGSCKRCYLSVENFLDQFSRIFQNVQTFRHGPCISDKDQTIDFAFCIRSKYLPTKANQWASRHRWQWPPNFVIDRIRNCGCLLVPIGPKTLSDNEFLWRMSFSEAEKILVHSFNFTQLLCYGLLKLTLKRIINTNDEVKDLLCSYFLKTALFWVSEEVDIDTFQLSKIYYCFSLCLQKLISWVNTCCCLNYFIPEQNMFLGKIDQSNNKILLGVLEGIQRSGISELINNLFPRENKNLHSSVTKSESSFTMLDFVLYRNTVLTNDRIHRDMSSYYKALSCIQYLLKYESSTFIIDACKLYIGIIRKEIVQLLPLPNTIGNVYNIRKCYQTHFQHIIKTDAMSGWSLYASFYYVTGQFNVTLRITDYVLSKCIHCFMFTDSYGNSELFKNDYRHNVHSSMTLQNRVTIATVQHVHYGQHSSLIPKELQLEVEFGRMNILPNVMSRCLRFLCFYHLGEISNRRQALSDLYSTVKENAVQSLNTKSNELTILGVCFALSDDKDMAFQCYEEALQCEMYVCPSAEIRRSNLLEI